MTEPSPVKAVFAPAWPYLYSTSYSAKSEVIPSYSRTRVFNRDLTLDQLKPLIEDCPVPGRKLRRAGSWAALGTYGLMVALWLVFWATANLRGVRFDFTTRPAVDAADTASLDAGSAACVLLMLAAAAVWLVGVVLDFIARKKWAAAVTAAWSRHGGHIVRTRDLPEDRQRSVNCLGQRLNEALEALDANDPAAQALNLAARAAIDRYFELPVTSKHSRRVAQSDVQNESVQKVRDGYEAAEAAEKAALEDAENAVIAIETYVNRTKADNAGRQIIGLAKAILRGPAS